MTAVVSLAMSAVIVCCVGHLVYTDLRHRIIPRRDCYLIAVCGSVLQFFRGGFSALLAGCGFGLLALGFCVGVEVVGRHASRRKNLLGGGDMRLIVALSLVTGPWAIWGAFGAALVALLWAVIGIASCRMSIKDTFPLAPCLACWPVVSFGVSLL